MTSEKSIVADLVERLNADLREAYEERAGIMEWDGGLPRDFAECLALLEVLRGHPTALAGVAVLKVERGGDTRLVLVTDVDRAADRLTDAGLTVVGDADLLDVLAQLEGVALIGALR